jgi:outer membrane protein assembly factor BamB
VKKRYFAAVLMIILVLSVFFITEVKSYADWPRWRGPDGNGISAEKDWNPEALSKNYRLVWKANVGIGFSSFSIKGEALYTMGNKNEQDTVYCINARTGKIIWHYSYPCSLGQHPGPRATPTIDGNWVYTLSRQGDLFCFSAADGKVRWQKNITGTFDVRPPQWGFAGSPVVEGELLLLNAGRSGIALDKKTGKKIWAGKSGIGGYATPVIYDYKGKRYAAIFGQKELIAVEVKTGKEAWSYPWRTRYDVNASDPLIMGNQIFISSNYGAGCALLELNGNKPRVLWKNGNMSSHFSSFIYIDGYIYGNDGFAGSRGGTFRCLDSKNGEVVWSESLGFGSLIAADGKLILLNERGDLFIAKATPSSYEEISSASGVLARTCWTPPVLCNGLLYCRNNRGDLVCIDISK